MKLNKTLEPIKGALKSIMRIPFRSALLFLIIFFLSFFIILCLSMYILSSQIKKNIELPIKGLVEVLPLSSFHSTPDVVLPYFGIIKEYSATAELKADIANVTPVMAEKTDSETGNIFYLPYTFKILGIQSLNIQPEFLFEEKIIVTGEKFTEEMMKKSKKVVMIDETLAMINSLKVGDTIDITFKNLLLDIKTHSPSICTHTSAFEIVAIYKDKIKPSGIEQTAHDVRSNHLYIPMNTAKDMWSAINSLSKSQFGGMELTYSNYFFILKEPKAYKQLETKINKAPLFSARYRLISYDEENQRSNAAAYRILDFVRFALLFMVFITIVLVLFITILITRRRMREIGILRSLGKSKKKIFAQIMVEFLLVITLALAVGGGLGTVFSPVITDTVLNMSAETTQKVVIENTTVDSVKKQAEAAAQIEKVEKTPVLINFYLFLLSGILIAILILTIELSIYLSKKPLKLLSAKVGE